MRNNGIRTKLQDIITRVCFLPFGFGIPKKRAKWLQSSILYYQRFSVTDIKFQFGISLQLFHPHMMHIHPSVVNISITKRWVCNLRTWKIGNSHNTEWNTSYSINSVGLEALGSLQEIELLNCRSIPSYLVLFSSGNCPFPRGFYSARPTCILEFLP